MNVLVAGGAGYIGSVVTQQLIETGHTVTIYDNLSKGHRRALPDQAQFELGDILDRSRLDEVLGAGCYNAVMHFAAFIEAGESMKEPGRFFHNNVTGSLTLIEAAVAHQVQRFVFSSSAGVYASQERPIVETDPIGAASVYGHTKRMIEEMLGWYHRIYGLRYAVLRYFNAAGATENRGEAHQPESHLIPLVLQVALGQRETIAVYGSDYPTPDGTCIRDYIHIADLATAHLLALQGLETRSQMIYNLGNGTGYSVLEVIQTAREITGQPIPVRLAPRRPGDPARLVASSEKAHCELGWVPRYPDLHDIILSAWQWHKQHPDGFGDRHAD
jgi:UDP-glucose 4-epimerase